MATVVVNELTIEPTANPPATEVAAAPPAAARTALQLEREVARLSRRRHERELRRWAH